MYVPLDSHDTERFKTLVGGNTDKLKLAFLFQMAFPGAPAVYYGDEIGLEGGKDPDSAACFPMEGSRLEPGAARLGQDPYCAAKTDPQPAPR